MKNKILSCSMALIILEIICLFIPFCFKEEHWEYTNSIVYHGESSHRYDINVNIFGVYHDFVTVLAIILIATMLVSFTAYLLLMLKKENKLTSFAPWLPILTFALLIIFTIISYSVRDDYTDWYFEWSINWLYYVIILLHIVVVIFSLILKFKNLDDSVSSTIVSSTKGNYSELEELKSLLDKGILSQEEFEAKKKQLLGF